MRSAKSQRIADEFLDKGINGIEADEQVDSQSDSSATTKSDEVITEQESGSGSECDVESEIAFVKMASRISIR